MITETVIILISDSLFLKTWIIYSSRWLISVAEQIYKGVNAAKQLRHVWRGIWTYTNTTQQVTISNFTAGAQILFHTPQKWNLYTLTELRRWLQGKTHSHTCIVAYVVTNVAWMWVTQLVEYFLKTFSGLRQNVQALQSAARSLKRVTNVPHACASYVSSLDQNAPKVLQVQTPLSQGSVVFLQKLTNKQKKPLNE